MCLFTLYDATLLHCIFPPVAQLHPGTSTSSFQSSLWGVRSNKACSGCFEPDPVGRVTVPWCHGPPREHVWIVDLTWGEFEVTNFLSLFLLTTRRWGIVYGIWAPGVKHINYTSIISINFSRTQIQIETTIYTKVVSGEDGSNLAGGALQVLFSCTFRTSQSYESPNDITLHGVPGVPEDFDPRSRWSSMSRGDTKKRHEMSSELLYLILKLWCYKSNDSYT